MFKQHLKNCYLCVCVCVRVRHFYFNRLSCFPYHTAISKTCTQSFYSLQLTYKRPSGMTSEFKAGLEKTLTFAWMLFLFPSVFFFFFCVTVTVCFATTYLNNLESPMNAMLLSDCLHSLFDGSNTKTFSVRVILPRWMIHVRDPWKSEQRTLRGLQEQSCTLFTLHVHKLFIYIYISIYYTPSQTIYNMQFKLCTVFWMKTSAANGWLPLDLASVMSVVKPRGIISDLQNFTHHNIQSRKINLEHMNGIVIRGVF